jgi:hypothetical protein
MSGYPRICATWPTNGYSARPRSETALWRSTLDTVQSPFLPRCLPSIKLTPTQWFRYHWRYTTSTAWGRTSRNRSLRERPHWNAANVTAMAEVAEALRLADVLRQYSPQPSAQEWAGVRLALNEAWSKTEEPVWKLDEWLTRRTFQLLDQVLAD